MDKKLNLVKDIHLSVIPARVTHQSGTRYANRRTYKTSSLVHWERTLSDLLKVHIPKTKLEGPIRLDVEFGYPAREKKKQQTWKVTKPDTDNAIKTLKDVMTKLEFWQDDAQVAFETCKKIWVKEPYIKIQIITLSDTDLRREPK